AERCDRLVARSARIARLRRSLYRPSPGGDRWLLRVHLDAAHAVSLSLAAAAQLLHECAYVLACRSVVDVGALDGVPARRPPEEPLLCQDDLHAQGRAHPGRAAAPAGV